MRSKYLISLVSILLVAVIVSAVFASGIIAVPNRYLSFMGFEPDAGTEKVFMDPRWYIKVITSQPVGSVFTVHVNVSDVTDLYAYGVNVTWNPTILTFSRIVAYGDFLDRTGSPYGTSRIEPTKANVSNSASIAETILGEYPGITGKGRLFSVEFKVKGYGTCDWSISVIGNMPTMLLSSAGAGITFTPVKGTFDNRIPGDITGPENPPGSGIFPYDAKVDTYDLSYLGKKFGSHDAVADFTGPENPPASGTYPPDGNVDTYDLSALGKNFGKHYP